MVHFFFLPLVGFLPVCCFVTSAIFLVFISRIKSKNALSTFSRVFADVSMYGLPHLVALPEASSCLTVRLAAKSDLLPIKIIGMSSVFFTLSICSLFKWKKNFHLNQHCQERPMDIKSPEFVQNIEWLVIDYRKNKKETFSASEIIVTDSL